MDKTENVRRILTHLTNSAVQSDDPNSERKRLEAEWGTVWDTKEVSENFTIEGFMAPFCVARRKSDDVKGTIMFQDRPRFYFNFKPA